MGNFIPLKRKKRLANQPLTVFTDKTQVSLYYPLEYDVETMRGIEEYIRGHSLIYSL
jgi:hypothetical protein